VLPDDVLLAIFDFYLVRVSDHNKDTEAWQLLVHVCRRWRCVVFGSPRRLNLRLICPLRTPVRESLDVWPALPLIVTGAAPADNIVVALGHSDRVCEINLWEVRGGLEWDKVLVAMQVPFPALTGLLLCCRQGMDISIIPDTFLGGSAPRLQYLTLDRIPFPGIPNLLLSATHLVDLCLLQIPHSGYVSPEALATCLSVLTDLDTLSLSLSIEFPYSRSRQRPSPISRFILPGLTTFRFDGVSKYLDDLVARIDAPRLHELSITFPLDQMNFDAPHLVQFISRTPRFQEPNEAHVTLDFYAKVNLFWASDDRARLDVEIIYDDIEVDPEPSSISSIAQVCTRCLPPLPTVENLRLGIFTKDLYSDLNWKENVENNQWLELLRPFPSVKSLYLSEELQPDMASALQELVGDRTTEVLPFLQNIFLARFEPSGSFQEAIGQFVAARRLSGHPLVVLPL
jgi:F-box-like